MRSCWLGVMVVAASAVVVVSAAAPASAGSTLRAADAERVVKAGPAADAERAARVGPAPHTEHAVKVGPVLNDERAAKTGPAAIVGGGGSGRPDVGAPAVGPTPGATTPAGAPVLMARYAFNGRSAPIADESGRGHTLRIISGHGGTVRAVAHGRGSALLFPPRCLERICPHVALQTPSTADLNPGARNISYGADVFLRPTQTSKGQNVIQKGYSTRGSQWKLQIDGVAGRPSCVLVGDRSPRIRMATSVVSVADSRWHRVRCTRIGGTLSVWVDNVLRGRIGIPPRLSVTNNRPMSIGGKGAYVDNDQFNGALDNVWVQIG
ncbi:MAG: LamG-like jellyroll fold domain-containing protein [Actinomycetota bacterium]|nr:LamG-like jellyroll fold domain-containing protein [Actinomycetota bacterium]